MNKKLYTFFTIKSKLLATFNEIVYEYILEADTSHKNKFVQNFITMLPEVSTKFFTEQTLTYFAVFYLASTFFSKHPAYYIYKH